MEFLSKSSYQGSPSHWRYPHAHGSTLIGQNLERFLRIKCGIAHFTNKYINLSSDKYIFLNLVATLKMDGLHFKFCQHVFDILFQEIVKKYLRDHLDKNVILQNLCFLKIFFLNKINLQIYQRLLSFKGLKKTFSIKYFI